MAETVRIIIDDFKVCKYSGDTELNTKIGEDPITIPEYSTNITTNSQFDSFVGDKQCCFGFGCIYYSNSNTIDIFARVSKRNDSAPRTEKYTLTDGQELVDVLNDINENIDILETLTTSGAALNRLVFNNYIFIFQTDSVELSGVNQIKYLQSQLNAIKDIIENTIYNPSSDDSTSVKANTVEELICEKLSANDFADVSKSITFYYEQIGSTWAFKININGTIRTYKILNPNDYSNLNSTPPKLYPEMKILSTDQEWSDLISYNEALLMLSVAMRDYVYEVILSEYIKTANLELPADIKIEVNKNVSTPYIIIRRGTNSTKYEIRKNSDGLNIYEEIIE